MEIDYDRIIKAYKDGAYRKNFDNLDYMTLDVFPYVKKFLFFTFVDERIFVNFTKSRSGSSTYYYCHFHVGTEIVKTENIGPGYDYSNPLSKFFLDICDEYIAELKAKRLRKDQERLAKAQKYFGKK